MPSISKNTTGKQLKVTINKPVPKSAIDKALQNPDLRRIASVLIDNQDDPGFLMSVENHINKELEKERKCDEGMNPKFRSRRAFWQALKLAAAEQRKRIQYSQFHSFINRNYPLLRESEIPYLYPILLTDELTDLMEKSGVSVEEFSIADIRKLSESATKVLTDEMIIWFQRPDGTLIQMVILDKKHLNSRYSFALRKVLVLNNGEEL